jgi:ligand-binding sensor domain-containing protein
MGNDDGVLLASGPQGDTDARGGLGAPRRERGNDDVRCLSGCAAQRAESLASPQFAPPTTKSPSATAAKTPLSPFIRRIFEDRSGDLWFGTNGDGVAHYNGKAVEFFCEKEGFVGLAVRAIVQDKHDAIWFGTDRGLIKYVGVKFTTYTTEQGLAHDDIWSVIIDRDGLLWIGTFGGVSRFDGKTFTAFPLPAVEPNLSVGVTSERMVLCIMQDKGCRMWFWLGGWQGLFRFDGDTIVSVDKDGPWEVTKPH